MVPLPLPWFRHPSCCPQPIIRAIIPSTPTVSWLFEGIAKNIVNNAPPFKYALNRRQRVYWKVRLRARACV